MKISFQIVHRSENISNVLFDVIKGACESIYFERTDEILKSFYTIKYNLKLRNSKYIVGFEIEVGEINEENYSDFLENFAERIKTHKNIYML